MDTNRIIFEYGKAQLHILMLQEQLQALNGEVAALSKQLNPKDNASDTKTDEALAAPVEVKRRGRPKAPVTKVIEEPTTAEDLQAAL